ncbi:hypothetical protein PybrP1_006139 [[Pythium] brassicae (nom. inval.)]|nr:hypothetical protein PybrP1_006139 [[Pythium] brassicae (nom. inval.)]
MQAMLAGALDAPSYSSSAALGGYSSSSPRSSSKAEKDVAPFLKNLRMMLDVESDAATVCTFSNDYFLRDQPELAWRISRKKSLHHGGAALPQLQLQQQLRKFAAKPRPSSSGGSSSSAGRVLAAPTPRLQPWVKAESVAISVPTTRDGGGRVPFPSPTDQDMMLKEHDQSARRHQLPQPLQYTFASQLHQQQSPEAMDWIDCLLPPVDRIEDEMYAYMYSPPAACAAALAGSSSHALKAPSYDFV